jgi:hypothetical protein
MKMQNLVLCKTEKMGDRGNLLIRTSYMYTAETIPLCLHSILDSRTSRDDPAIQQQ